MRVLGKGVVLGALLIFGTAAAIPAQAQPAAAKYHKTVRAMTENSDTGIYVFQPKKLKVKVGTKVTWTDPSDTDHNVTAISTNWKMAKDLMVGGSVSYTFKKPGTYTYSCTIHPGMTGKIIVSKSG